MWGGDQHRVSTRQTLRGTEGLLLVKRKLSCSEQPEPSVAEILHPSVQQQALLPEPAS